jgi:hypothetical protein
MQKSPAVVAMPALPDAKLSQQKVPATIRFPATATLPSSQAHLTSRDRFLFGAEYALYMVAKARKSLPKQRLRRRDPPLEP